MELATERLSLRPPEPSDLAAVVAMRADPEARRYLGGPMPPETTRRQFEHARHSWMLGEPSLLIVRSRETGDFVGLAGPWGMFGQGDAEVVWEVRPELWGRGYAFEAAQAVLNWLLIEAGWGEVRFYIAPGNLASLALARRLGAEPVSEAPLRSAHRRPNDILLTCRRDGWQRSRARGCDQVHQAAGVRLVA